MSSQTNQANSLNFLQNVGLYKLVTTSQIVIQTLDNKYPDPGAILFMGPSGNVQYANDLTIPGVFKPLGGLFGTTATFSNTLTAGSLFLADYGIFNGLLTALGGLSTTTGSFTELIFGSVISGPTANFNTVIMSGPIVGQAANFAGPLIAAGGLYVTAAATFTGPVTFESNIIGYDAIFTNSVLSTGVLRSTGIFTNTGLILGQDATFTGLLTALGGFSGGTATFSGAVNAEAGIIATTAVIQNISGGTATFSEVVTFNGGLVGLTGTFSGLLTANGGLLVTGGMRVNGGTTFNGSVTATGGILCGGTFTSTGTIVAAGAIFSGAVSVGTLTAGAATFNSTVTALAGIVIDVPNSLETAWINKISQQGATFGGPAIIPRLTVPIIDGCVDMNPSGNALTIYGSVNALKTINASTVSVTQIRELRDVNSAAGTTATIGGTVDFQNYYTLNTRKVLQKEIAGQTFSSDATISQICTAFNSLMSLFYSRQIFLSSLGQAPPPTSTIGYVGILTRNPLYLVQDSEPNDYHIVIGYARSEFGTTNILEATQTLPLLNNTFMPGDFKPENIIGFQYYLAFPFKCPNQFLTHTSQFKLEIFLQDINNNRLQLINAQTGINSVKAGELWGGNTYGWDRLTAKENDSAYPIVYGTPMAPDSSGRGMLLEADGTTPPPMTLDDAIQRPGNYYSRPSYMSATAFPAIKTFIWTYPLKLYFKWRFYDPPNGDYYLQRNNTVGPFYLYYNSYQ